MKVLPLHNRWIASETFSCRLEHICLACGVCIRVHATPQGSAAHLGRGGENWLRKASRKPGRSDCGGPRAEQQRRLCAQHDADNAQRDHGRRRRTHRLAQEQRAEQRDNEGRKEREGGGRGDGQQVAGGEDQRDVYVAEGAADK